MSEGPFLFEIRRIRNNENSTDAYDALYSNTSLSQIESFYLWLMDQLRLPPHGRLLDVSCGAGELMRLAAQRGLCATGIDISEVVARAAKRTVTGSAQVCAAAGESLPFADASFDFVTNIGSLEHFIDPALGVREMSRVLRHNGQAFVLVPNTFSLLSNIWIAFRHGHTSVDEQPIQRYGARADWAALLEQNGLCVQRTLKYERPLPRTRADWQLYLRKPKQMLRAFAAPLVPLNLAFCFLYVCLRE